MQENEYLKNAVAKIAAFKPEVLLVEKVVSGVAQEFLSNLGVTLVLNVKPAVMDRVSRSCQADIVPSIDAHQLSRPKLGSCRLFHVETLVLDRAGASKTLMFFDGCQPRLGCTVLLRGSGHAELRKAKKVLRFMAFACYSGRLEQSFLADEFALPKNLPMAMQSVDLDEVSSEGPQPDAHSSPISAGRGQETTTFDNSSLVIVDSESLANAAAEPNASQDRRDEEDYPQIKRRDQQRPDGEEKADLKPVRELDDPLHEYLRSQQAGGLLGGEQSLSSTPVRESRSSGMNIGRNNDDPAVNRALVQSNVLATNSMLFRKAMEDTILSVSPLLRHGLPYLETEAGRKAPLRKYLPEVLYYSQQLKQSESPPRKLRYAGGGGGGSSLLPTDEASEELSSPTGGGGRADQTIASRTSSFGRSTSTALHPFLRAKISPSMSKTELQALLNDFRARGVRPGGQRPGSYGHGDQHLGATGANNNKLSLTSSDDWENISSEDQTGAGGSGRLKDCLDPFNLQRLCVLFSSYCPSSAVAPHYCVAPWYISSVASSRFTLFNFFAFLFRVVEMDFYGRNDIALGGFLERYCFHQQVRTSSETFS